MSLLANSFIVLFILGMAALWSTYGLFSGLMNLVAVLCAGALAFASWEPVSFKLLDMGLMSGWGVGLLLPFLLYYGVMRLGMDVLIRRNVDSWPLAQQIGGGAFGAIAGVFSAGLMVIGFGYMTPESTFMGIQPFKVEGGKITANTESPKLWLAVDRITGGTFEALSSGALAPSGQSETLSKTRGNVAARTAWSRLAASGQAEASRYASPKGVSVEGALTYTLNAKSGEQLLAYGAAMALLKNGNALPDKCSIEELKAQVATQVKAASESPEGAASAFNARYLENTRGNLGLNASALGEEVLDALVSFQRDCVASNKDKSIALDPKVKLESALFAEAGRWVIVETLWNKDLCRAYDEGSLRLAANQARLVLAGADGQTGEEVLPIAWSNAMAATTTGRELIALSGAAYGVRPANPEHLTLIYRVPAAAVPTAIYLRELRVPLHADEVGPMAAAKWIGHITPPTVTGKAPVTSPSALVMPSGEYGSIKATDRLPKPISTVQDTGMDLKDNPKKNTRAKYILVGGKFHTEAPVSGINEQRCDDLYVPPGKKCLQLEMTYKQYQSLYGKAVDLAESIVPIQLETDGGMEPAQGFIVIRGNAAQDVDLHPNAPGVSRKDFAELRPEIGAEDKVYVFFFVSNQTSVNGLQTGANAHYKFSTPIDAATLP